MSMNKIKIDGVLIVEGKEDVSYLSSFIDAHFFITNGYDLSKEKIDFLNQSSKVNTLIIFTDPDIAGEEIREKISESVIGVKHARSEDNRRKGYKKHGVAELTKEEVIKALSPFITNEFERQNYDLSSLISLSDNPKENREKLIKKYRLIDGNNKYLENQLNILKIKAEEVKELLSGN